MAKAKKGFKPLFFGEACQPRRSRAQAAGPAAHSEGEAAASGESMRK